MPARKDDVSVEKSFAQKLCAINNAFYRDNASSFSATRKSPWDGWRISAQSLEDAGFLGGSNSEALNGADSNLSFEYQRGERPLRVLDLAAGNLRYESFLAEAYPHTPFEFIAVDDCTELADAHNLSQEKRRTLQFESIDIVQMLIAQPDASQILDTPPSDISVCFGFMHHLPTAAMRKQVIDLLISHTVPGGFIVISFWEFLNNEALARKAKLTHKQALVDLELSAYEQDQLSERDFFLGWKETQSSYRYCHSFSSEEIDALLEPFIAQDHRVEVVSRFLADGRTHNLNEYVVLRVLERSN